MNRGIFFLALFFIVSCSQIYSKPSNVGIRLSSYPESAKVKTYDLKTKTFKDIGETPTIVEIEKSTSDEIIFLQIEKYGYAPQNVILDTKSANTYEIQVNLKKLEAWIDFGQKHSAQIIEKYAQKQNRINFLVTRKNYDEALVINSDLITEFPYSSILYAMRGSIYLLMGNKVAAIKDYEYSQKLSNSDPTIEKILKNLKGNPNP